MLLLCRQLIVISLPCRHRLHVFDSLIQCCCVVADAVNQLLDVVVDLLRAAQRECLKFFESSLDFLIAACMASLRGVLFVFHPIHQLGGVDERLVYMVSGVHAF